ncbi:MAG: hypothetical protein WBA83_00065 [Burkholderiaceae bacterium]
MTAIMPSMVVPIALVIIVALGIPPAVSVSWVAPIVIDNTAGQDQQQHCRHQYLHYVARLFWMATILLPIRLSGL